MGDDVGNWDDGGNYTSNNAGKGDGRDASGKGGGAPGGGSGDGGDSVCILQGLIAFLL